MRIVLVAMPWLPIAHSSLALGILSAVIERDLPSDIVTCRYANLEWAKWLLLHSDGVIDPTAVSEVARMANGSGDWVFSSAIRGESAEAVAEYEAFLARQGRTLSFTLREMYRRSPAFVAELADSITQERPDLVGFTTTFNQTAASVALARALKNRLPQCAIVFGGAGCDGPQGSALQRAFPFIDYVISGEGEQALPALARAIKEGQDFETVPGLAWRSYGRQMINPPGALIDLSTVPSPNYDSWIEQVANSEIDRFFEPTLVLESSRGCWWGQKNQCVFCGLNGPSQIFRSKPPAQFVAEVLDHVRRDRILNIYVTDNIIDQAYFDSAFPTLADLDYDLWLHYETKSNITRDQIAALREANIVHLQPGIESLSTAVLRLMRKGVTGPRNVRHLREMEEAGLAIDWNILYGFVGEKDEDYRNVIDQMPALVHLQPPVTVNRFFLLRFSPYFEQAGNLFPEAAPAEFYSYVYGLSDDALMGIASEYAYKATGLGGQEEADLQGAADYWRSNYRSSFLSQFSADNRIFIDDRRQGWPKRTIMIDDPAQVLAFRALSVDTTVQGLDTALHKAGFTIDSATIEAWLRSWRVEGLVFEDGARFVSLPTRSLTDRIKL